MTKFTKRFCLNLADSFPGYRKHFSNFLKRFGAPVFKTKPLFQNPSFSVRKSPQYLIYLFLKKLTRRGIKKGWRGYVMDKVSKPTILFISHRTLQTCRLLRDFNNLECFFNINTKRLSNFLRVGLTSQLLSESSRSAQESINVFYHMNGDANSARLIRDSPSNGLANPPCCISRKLKSPSPVVFFNRTD